MLSQGLRCAFAQRPFVAVLNPQPEIQRFVTRTCLHQRYQQRPVPSRLSLRGQQLVVRAADTDEIQSAVYNPTTAKDAVEKGLEVFKKEGDPAEALRLFQKALELRPSDDEARAALYNSACSYAKLKEWSKATDAVVRAVNDYDLKLSVALADSDLRALRERREWLDALSVMKGGVTQEQFIKLRAESRAPFRLTRIIFFGGLAAGAGVGLIIILNRLISAFKGGEGAPDLQETLQNLGINVGAVAVLLFLLIRDLQAEQKDKTIIAREESLALLQVQTSPERSLPLASFRGVARPVIIAGSKGHVQRAIKAAESFQDSLRERGVTLIPVVANQDDYAAKLKLLKQGGFRSPQGGKGFAEERKSDIKQVKQASKKDRKWELEAAAVEEWLQWLEEQKKAAGTTAENVYVQVQLDGRVRKSGTGLPPWEQFLADLPPLDDVRTQFTDGVARR